MAAPLLKFAKRKDGWLMKIGEAKIYYRERLEGLREKQETLFQKQKDLDIKTATKEEQGVILELSEQVQKQIDETQKFLSNLSMLETGLYNAEASKRQGEAMAEAYEDMGKCIETARRIASGAQVPPSDEQKLMEFSMEMYLAAKSAAMNMDDDEEYDSLWEDEEDSAQEPDIDEMVAGHEVSLATPELPDIDINI